ncbi:J domain-containing protein [Larkinella knui]|uniref:J domain-containing protein n=1 Tax=Larkinella knui TaxID=2025310 RepID=A0A3P1CGV9_9BACT|nr:hypothetical protein [Larkinella knui]RRB12589.1 hypothetical protein EHT87_20575 [Larkinella knui]
MEHPAQQIIRIGSTKDKDTLSKSQKEFNRLTRKIETLEKDLVDYRDATTRIQQHIQTELLPLQTEYHQQRAALVRVFDRAHDSGSFKANERKKLVDIILNLAFPLISEYGFDDLKPIYDKYDSDGFDATNAGADDLTTEAMKEMYSRLFGVDFDEDADVSSPEKVAEHLRQKREAQQTANEEQQRQTEERRAQRPKTKKQLEREAKKETEERSITKAVRTVYMDLVKAFHPDREPDETEKGRKTEVMKRITEAYEKSDLLALLRLQLEFNRIDQNHLETLAEEQLKYYNKILKQQTQELEEQLHSLQAQLSAMSGRSHSYVWSPMSLEYRFKADVQELKQAIKRLKNELKAFQDPSVLRHWLKSYRIQKAGDFDGF